MQAIRAEHCFSETALEFAVHPTEEQMAFAWLTMLREQHIGWSRAQAQIVEFLKARGAGGGHIEQQVSRAKLFLEPWLLD
jgi:hypothetical protein